jgi:adenosine deaminase
MNAQLISKSFSVIGIKKECLYKNFHTALHEAMTEFKKVISANSSNIIVMTRLMPVSRIILLLKIRLRMPLSFTTVDLIWNRI